jgi:hypothetical protein
MKRFPDITAQEILWSFFIPNDEALAEAREIGYPKTISEIIDNFTNYNDCEEKTSLDVEPCDKYGLYLLKTYGNGKMINYEIREMAVVAKSSTQAREIAASDSGRYEHPKDYNRNKIWKDVEKTMVTLLFPFRPLSTCQTRFRPRIVCASSPFDHKIQYTIIKYMRDEIKKELEKQYIRNEK